MDIWVDADACPVPIKEIVYRAANRTGLKAILVANHRMKIPKARNVHFKLVDSGFDKADDYIEQTIQPGDILITNDIPLAAAALKKETLVISTKGELFTANNINERLNIRDFLDTMRSSGINTGGPPPLNKSDIKNFADSLDRLITQHQKNS